MPGGFRYCLQASNVSSQTEELWYNETVCLWMTTYIYIYKILNYFLVTTFLHTVGYNFLTYFHIYLHHHRHHHVALPARISLTLSSHILYTELLYIGSSWLACLFSFMWWRPQKYVTYEFVLTSPAASRMFGSSNLDIFVMGVLWPYSCCFVSLCL